MTVEIRALAPDDDRTQLCSGEPALDEFFRRYAGQNQFRHHIGVTYVAVKESRILGFVTVAPASMDADALPSGRRMPPYPLPVLRIARLAVDEGMHGSGLGKSLLRFAIELAERMRDELGCAGVLVDAKPDAASFYARYGFVSVEGVEGAPARVPRPILMYLPLGSVPPPR